ncbi:MAG: NAD(P)/FAD-dependent oxidoreductase [Chloroflexi bacterium]|nr:NAD(P)/FAD-dependent oxidoreductase [Chloroflexota bacterium]
MVRDKYDFIIIGAGPNGLAISSYLAKAGQTVLALERRPEAGGGLATEAVTLSDFAHNTHAVYMMMADYAPIYQDFRLEKHYQVKHLHPSLQFTLPLSDGKAVCLYSDVEETCQSLAKFSKKDAEAYRNLYHLADKAVREFIAPATYSPAVPALDQVVKLQNAGAGKEILEYSEKTPVQIVDEFFENEHVKALMLYAATHWGVAPEQAGLGYLVLLYLNRASNYRLVVGGSHMVAQALNKIIHENGGAVWNNVRIKRIIIEGGAAGGVELTDGTVLRAAKAVISTVDPGQTFLKLVGEGNLDGGFVESIKGWQWEKHSLLGIHLAMTEAPRFAAAAANPDIDRSFVYVLGYETPDDLLTDYEDIDQGRFSDQARFNCCFPTVHDPSQAPPGRHTGLISRFAPYDLKGGTQKWYGYKFKEAVAEKCLDTLRHYAPNMTPDKVLWKYVTTPVDIENKFNDMVKGSFKQGLYDPFQMGYLRPNEQCSHHRTPIKNLYLGGSSSYPGGCVIWGSGYLAANAVAEDCGIKKWWSEPEMVTTARQKGLL